MRDNYVGDIGDYYKYDLLQQLTGENPIMRLGVAWYLYPDPCNPNDGRHTAYLNDARYRSYNPKLYDQLKKLVADEKRNIKSVRESGILPPGTLFHETPLSYSALPKGTTKAIEQRLAHRSAWLQEALAMTRDADIIFFDPDNGLQIKSVSKHKDKAPKFTFYDELAPFWERGQSLVVYQHGTRQGSLAKQIQSRLKVLKETLPDIGMLETSCFTTLGVRIFYVIGQKRHADLLHSRLAAFADQWKRT